MHRATPQFWRRYASLPKVVRELADKNFELLKENSAHPSLQFKKVGAFWSARVGRSYRAMAIEDGEDYTWVWIGGHDEYEEMIKRG
jgi:hypothetical protein